jgi:large subunit ribosomal protein L10
VAKTRQQKEEVIQKAREVFASAKNVVFAKFHGLSVSQTSAMRKTLKGKGIGYFVAKKTLTRRALQDLPIEGSIPELEGEMALAWSDDETAAAREIYTFEKEYAGAVSIMGGVFENRYLSKDEMGEIARIPGVEILRGMFVNVINSPIQGLAIALSEITKKKS